MDENLLKYCAETRYQFLKVDLQLLYTGLEMGTFELARGNVEIAHREAAAVQKGIQTIGRLLPGIAEEKRCEVESGLAALRERYEEFRAKLATQGPE
jgi:hypothetical protein